MNTNDMNNPNNPQQSNNPQNSPADAQVFTNPGQMQPTVTPQQSNPGELPSQILQGGEKAPITGVKSASEIFQEQTDGRAAPKQLALPNGKVLTILEPKGSVQFRVAALMPSELADNNAMFAMAQQTFYIHKIDGVLTSPPKTIADVQAIADMIGDEGIVMLRLFLSQEYPPSQMLQDKFKSQLENL